MEEAEEEDGEAGKRDILRMLDPKLPSRAEVEEHELTHLPYRNWCRHCVKGRGKEAPHKKQNAEKEAGMPEVHWDFMFLGEENDAGNALTILVAKERTTKIGMSSVAPNKSTGEFLSKTALAYLSETGVENGDVKMKLDQNQPCVVLGRSGRRRRAEGMF